MSKKRHNPKSNSPAAFIPCWLIQVSTNFLSQGAKLVYGRLAQWSTEKGDVYRLASQLAIELGTNTRQIERQIKELKDVELIDTFLPQAGGVNHFIFYDHEWMYQPIKKQLVYYSDNSLPSDNANSPSDTMSDPLRHHVGPPPTNPADINIKEIKEIKCVGENPHTQHNEPLKSKKEKAEEDALRDPEINELFKRKFEGLTVTIEELFLACQSHYDQKGSWATRDKFMKWVKNEQIENYKKYNVHPLANLSREEVWRRAMAENKEQIKKAHRLN